MGKRFSKSHHRRRANLSAFIQETIGGPGKGQPRVSPNAPAFAKVAIASVDTPRSFNGNQTIEAKSGHGPRERDIVNNLGRTIVDIRVAETGRNTLSGP
jgi:hypothetical protein